MLSKESIKLLEDARTAINVALHAIIEDLHESNIKQLAADECLDIAMAEDRYEKGIM